MGVQQTAKQTPDTKAGYAAARTTANSALANMPGNVKLGHGGTYDAQGNITFGEWTPDEAARRMNPYTDEVIDKTLSDMQRQWQLESGGINDSALEAGAFGGSRHGIQQAEGFRNTLDRMGSASAGLRKAGYDTARGEYDTDRAAVVTEQNANAGAAADRMSLGTSAANLLSSIGADQQKYEQGILDKAKAEMEWRNGGYQKDNLNWLQSINAMSPYSRESTNVNIGPGPDTTGQLIGGGVSAIGALAPLLLSDERAKENITPADPEQSLAELVGLPISDYDYTQEAQEMGMPESRTGPMAQDYQQIGETGETDNGLMTIDPADMMGKIIAAIQALDKRTKAA